ncbi:hypothetical protein ACOME3_007414 [Neoechinorhynchus agilis]
MIGFMNVVVHFEVECGSGRTGNLVVIVCRRICGLGFSSFSFRVMMARVPTFFGLHDPAVILNLANAFPSDCFHFSKFRDNSSFSFCSMYVAISVSLLLFVFLTR